MRVSLPICIASSLAVVVLSWWFTTRSRDFLIPPSESELEGLRISAAQTNPTAQGLGDALSPAASQDKESMPIPVVLPRHVNRAPRLNDYMDEVKNGPGYLMELAKLLSKDHPERALSCWERVIDSSKADDSQQQRASKAIIRLKKEIHTGGHQHEEAKHILIQAGTGPTAASLLDSVLDEIMAQLEINSLGVIRGQTKISTGEEDMIEQGKSPVALWISGPEDSSGSTDVVSFFISVNSVEGLKQQVEREIYRIIRHHHNQMDNFQPLPKPSDQNLSGQLLEGQITRLAWENFAKSLQKGR